MRNATLCFLTLLGVVMAFGGLGFSQLEAQSPKPIGSQLIALSSDKADGHQQVTVIDPQARVMSVYHIQNDTGAISLKSARNISADLMMDEFNTDSPLPREIRAILSNR